MDLTPAESFMRDGLASLVMNGMLANVLKYPAAPGVDYKIFAEAAYKFADAMMEAREKK